MPTTTKTQKSRLKSKKSKKVKIRVKKNPLFLLVQKCKGEKVKRRKKSTRQVTASEIKKRSCRGNELSLFFSFSNPPHTCFPCFFFLKGEVGSHPLLFPFIFPLSRASREEGMQASKQEKGARRRGEDGGGRKTCRSGFTYFQAPVK